MRTTFKALSALLTYPTAELQAAVPEIRAAVHGRTSPDSLPPRAPASGGEGWQAKLAGVGGASSHALPPNGPPPPTPPRHLLRSWGEGRSSGAPANAQTLSTRSSERKVGEGVSAPVLKPAMLRQLDALLDDIAAGDLYDLQERYILLFDRTRSLSLHLFEHVHGESRDRGQAMIDLKNLYEEGGLLMGTSELPDFLPLFLEFLSTRPPSAACELLGQPVHILSALAERLRKRRTPYEAVFRALVALAAARPKDDAVTALLAEPDPQPDDLAALDKAWEDAPVEFGPGVADACKDGIIARVRADRRPAPGRPVKPAARPIVTHTRGPHA